MSLSYSLRPTICRKGGQMRKYFSFDRAKAIRGRARHSRFENRGFCARVPPASKDGEARLSLGVPHIRVGATTYVSGWK